ncbi:Metallo-dependent phosphatase-like protein [Cercophora newfieldiana]|uniref:Metallo-dependent phosphatase-like protein n=1 Tax=Cercophora newfieldiana TaxID=92897 RepID=A0AA39Y2Z2_9PEZI|nr:Metallo-dependent phosphatase-like protein [Cercophora newfieldiana]
MLPQRRPGAGGLDALLRRQAPSVWQQFWDRPAVVLARQFLQWRHPSTISNRPPHADAISVVCISDTHTDGDILIHAGDLTDCGTFSEVQAALDWLRSQPHRHKIVIAGNYDLLLDSAYGNTADSGSPERRNDERAELNWDDLLYLQDSDTTIVCANGRRLKIYGSPRTPKFGNWVFQYPRGENVWENTIPSDVNVLVTHGPPRAHLDLLNIGCDYLLREIWRVRPLLHVFGHVHGGRGQEWLPYSALQAAYEQTVIQRGGICSLALASWRFLASFWAVETRSGTLAVNAAIVGGPRDGERREPIKVCL